mmetsp:Transcript_45231/g.60024  ORF Transcript_45231/g.60024 Transcript_45231/m.60024 type:complete len:83 (-) Transcript_45231:424-672(-)
MSTCSKIGEALGITDIPLNYRYCEYLATFLYDENPVPKIGVRTKGIAALKSEKGMEAFNFTDDDAGFEWATTLYPEEELPGK